MQAIAGMVLAVVMVFAGFAPVLADGVPYDRAAFGQDVNAPGQDCMSMRHDLLTVAALRIARLDQAECRVVVGLWVDPYTGMRITAARKMQIDHLIPLAWAWRHGADRWTPAQRQAFNLDATFLRVVSRDANGQKGDAGPLTWLPPLRSAQCAYVTDFRRGIADYGLRLSVAEDADLAALSAQVCAGPVTLANSDLNCNDFATQSAAQAVLDSYRGADLHDLDREGDGIACEALSG